MKRATIIRDWMREGVTVLFGVLFLSPSVSTFAFSGSGAGVTGNPYVITTVGQLQEMNDALGAVYILGNNIDASSTSEWNGGGGFEPVGSELTPFTGSLDGQGHSITSLHLDWPSSNTIGLFRQLDAVATITNVWIVNSAVVGNEYVGLLAGISDATITNCHVSGAASGAVYVGGLLGANTGSVEACHSDAAVTGSSDSAGGVVGVNSTGGLIQRSYSTGPVSGVVNVGGFVGQNSFFATTQNCYSLGDVSGQSDVGGFYGLSTVFATIANCYSTGRASGDSNTGGFGGVHMGATCTNCFWDTESSGQTFSVQGTGKTTTQMKQRTTFDPPWNFSGVWSINEGRTYPFFYEGRGTQSVNIQPAVLAFGSRFVNQGAAVKEVFIFNMGAPSLTISSVSLTGDADFIILSDTGDETLASGAARVVKVGFDPASKGPATATLAISSNDPSHPSVDVAISGTGVNTPPVAKYFPAHQAVSLDGDNEIVTLTGNSDLRITTDTTLEAWVRPNTVSGTQSIVSWGGPGAGEGDNHLYEMRLRPTGDIGVYHNYGNLEPSISIDFDANLTTDTWTHVAVVRDCVAKTYTAYMNGVSLGSLSYSDNPTGGDVGVATAQIGADASWSNVFNGLIDDVRVWNVKRSQSEIQSDMSRELTGAETGLAGYWKFNEVDATRVTPDATGKGNDGTLQNQAHLVGPSEAMGAIDHVAFSTNEDTDTTVTLIGYDPDGDSLKAFVTQLPAAGTGSLYQYGGAGPIRGAAITAPNTEITDSAMRLVFAPSNRQTTYISVLRWKVFDGLEYSNNPTTCTITVSSDPDAAALVSHSLTCDNDAVTTITSTNLQAAGDWPISFRVDSLPSHGALLRGAIVLGAGDTFTQDDINTDLIHYDHDGSATTADSFNFSHQDSDSGWIPDAVFSITINPHSTVTDWTLIN